MALHVRNVIGRYPRRGVLRSDNIVTSVVEIGRIYRIRIDDEENADAWMEVTVEEDLVEGQEHARDAMRSRQLGDATVQAAGF